MGANLGAFFAIARALWAAAIDGFAPTACAACDAELHGRAVFCAACASTVERAPPRGTSAAVVFEGAAARAIRRMKFGARPDLARPLAELVRPILAPVAREVDVVIPVPLHPLRLAERGFNQAALLAAPLARAFDLAFAPRALARVRPTSQQARLSRRERRENVAGAFAARSARSVVGLRVLLVDDVATTGATLRACTAALELAGAASVHAIVVARAEALHVVA